VLKGDSLAVPEDCRKMLFLSVLSSCDATMYHRSLDKLNTKDMSNVLLLLGRLPSKVEVKQHKNIRNNLVSVSHFISLEPY
jgi:hypothetical protein